MTMTVAEYARHRGVSHVAVIKAAQEGRIRREPDGSIEPIAADRAWEAAVDQSQPKRGPKPKMKAVAKDAIASVREALGKDVGATPASGVSFVEAKTAHEVIKAHLARLKLQERTGALIDKTKAKMLVFELARQERDAWLNFPARVAATVAAELGVDRAAVLTALDKHVHEHLTQLGEIQVNVS